jgi:hypothetical protein
MKILVTSKHKALNEAMMAALMASLPGALQQSGILDIDSLRDPWRDDQDTLVSLNFADWNATPFLRLAVLNNELPRKFDRIVVLTRDIRDEVIERFLTAGKSLPVIDGCDLRIGKWMEILREALGSLGQCGVKNLIKKLQGLFGDKAFRPIQPVDRSFGSFLEHQVGRAAIFRIEDLTEQGRGRLEEVFGSDLASRLDISELFGSQALSIAPGTWRHFFTAQDVAAFGKRWAKFMGAGDLDWPVDTEGGVAGPPPDPDGWLALAEGSWNDNERIKTAKQRPGVSTGSNRRGLIYVHVAKTAGTTVNDFISPHYAHEDVCVHAEVDPRWRDSRRRSELMQCAFISGHLTLPVMRSAFGQGDRASFATFRQPYSHMCSHLAWVKYLADPANASLLSAHSPRVQAVVKRVATIDLSDTRKISDFIRGFGEAERELFDNTQCRYLLRIPASEEVVESHLQEALCRLPTLDVIGLTERLEDSLRLLCHFMGWAEPGDVVRRNEARSKYGMDPKSPEFARAVEPAVWADLQLYREVEKLFAAHLEVFQSTESTDRRQ